MDDFLEYVSFCPVCHDPYCNGACVDQFTCEVCNKSLEYCECIADEKEILE